ncbi:M15 family metallopeptidase [Cellulomonas sp. SLBN-39]|uniref:M15 family metallopeptidase n=1 Tax=Cellulomonas sp. SLBN-39 TaxID=2768446 RepID=UPI001154F859|nr:M15 family metallopeptidase [Cellulomonas sp. SLBN-39]TQL02717.1 D-alanyl-D-alanine carboxypeptidase-like protein [Cellulomonas sp. SLBN-39]
MDDTTLLPPRAPATGAERPRPRRRRAVAVVGGLAALVVVAAAATAGLAGGTVPLPGPTAPSEPTTADGRIPDGETVSPFDDSLPAIAGLDPALLAALREAATAVGVDGRTLHVTSGWRSAAYQRWLQDDALRTFGSADEASRWVASPEDSAHVTGDAVDVGPYATAEWLSRHGAQFGLCQVYANEVWHLELRPDAADEGCPPMSADAAG